jgi:hypothetical protein
MNIHYERKFYFLKSIMNSVIKLINPKFSFQSYFHHKSIINTWKKLRQKTVYDSINFQCHPWYSSPKFHWLHLLHLWLAMRFILIQCCICLDIAAGHSSFLSGKVEHPNLMVSSAQLIWSMLPIPVMPTRHGAIVLRILLTSNATIVIQPFKYYPIWPGITKAFNLHPLCVALMLMLLITKALGQIHAMSNIWAFNRHILIRWLENFTTQVKYTLLPTLKLHKYHSDHCSLQLYPSCCPTSPPTCHKNTDWHVQSNQSLPLK